MHLHHLEEFHDHLQVLKAKKPQSASVKWRTTVPPHGIQHTLNEIMCTDTVAECCVSSKPLTIIIIIYSEVVSLEPC